MKAQTRRGSMIETGVNLVVGFGISWILNLVVLPWFGYHPSTDALLSLGLIFTLASIVRQYVLRRLFEWLRIRKAPPAFLYIVEELADERLRQIRGEGYSLDHDDRHTDGSLARAAAAYARVAGDKWNVQMAAAMWPWERAQFKYHDGPRRCLVKAGALLIAEIARRDRADERRCRK